MRNLALAIVSTLLFSLPCLAEDGAPAASNDQSTVAAAGQSHDSAFGFKLRIKASVGLLTRDLVEGKKFLDSGDVGLMIEPLHFHRATLNGYVGFRTIGLGIGHDVTDTFGVALLANTPYHEWRPTPVLAAYFAF